MNYDIDEDLTEKIQDAHYEATNWARNLLKRTDWVILDTETTGLGGSDQVIQVGMLAPDGAVVLDTLVKCSCEIDPRAQAVHGITLDMLVEAPEFPEVMQQIRHAAEGKYLVIYNGDFDLRMLRQSAIASNFEPAPFFMHYDAMLEYARWVGEWNEYRGDFRWQKLRGGDHSAIGDCRAVLELIKKMAE